MIQNWIALIMFSPCNASNDLLLFKSGHMGQMSCTIDCSSINLLMLNHQSEYHGQTYISSVHHLLYSRFCIVFTLLLPQNIPIRFLPNQ